MVKNKKKNTFKLKWNRYFIIPITLVVLVPVLIIAANQTSVISTDRVRITLSENNVSFWDKVLQALHMTAAVKPGDKFNVTAVAYSSSVDQTDASPCVTAAGTIVHEGIVATNFLPLGTRLKINDEIYTVEDRMNTKYNGMKIIDVWHPSRKAAIDFGKKRVEIEILPEMEEINPEVEVSPTPPPEPKTLWDKTKTTVSQVGDFFEKFLPTRAVNTPTDADCQKYYEQQLKSS